MGTGGFIPGVKWQGHEADQSPPSSAEVKNGGTVPPLSICLHGIMFNYIIKYRYNLFLRFTHVICMQVFIF
jgi:hypothetical protein